jgi:penicillin-binding protein 2
VRLNIYGKRIFFVVVIFLCVVFLYFARLYDMQIIHGEEERDRSGMRIYKDIETQAYRGVILDRNGLPLAVNTQTYDLYIQKAGLKDEGMNKALLTLYRILIKNGDSYIDNLSKYFTVDPFSFRDMTPDQIQNWQANIDTFNIKKENVIYDPKAFYEYLRDEYFHIDSALTQDEIYAIMAMRYEIITHGWMFFTGSPVKLAAHVSNQTIAEIEEQNHLMPGLMANVVPQRIYVNAENTAHVLGYIGMINQTELENNPGYSSSDYIGKTGVEAAAEQYLRGENGLRKMEVDQSGRIMTELKGIPAIPGNDVILTIDTRLQKVAMESLERTIQSIVSQKDEAKGNFGDANAGAAVAIDVKTGEVLVLASYPGYDPSVFIDNSQEAQEKRLELIFDNERRPLFNRALQAPYAPGSTFKPLVGIAALEEGILTPQKTILCDGSSEIGGRRFYCMEYVMGMGIHGHLTIERAIATSCNLYFFKLGVETGISNIDKWAQKFGLGEYTGIELPGENRGHRSNRNFKYTQKGEEWWIADTAQTAIGQLYNGFTPLQLANYAATIANGGKRMTPHIIKEVIDHNNNTVYKAEPEYEETGVSRQTLDIIIDGMQRVAQTAEGTADQYFSDFPIKIAGKTGTAETGKESESSSNGLFVCFAPADDPEIAVAVVIEKGVWGSYTAPVARDILAAYFNLDADDTALQSVGSFWIP